MKSGRRTTIWLLVLNALLVAAVAFLYRDGRRHAPRDHARVPSSRSDGQAEVTNDIPTTGANRPVARFHWRDHLLSTDLKKYVANLRGVNCPEETVRDIMIAEVDRLYRAREAALGLRREALKPWELGEANGLRSFDRIARLRELRLERQSLLRELLGIEIPVEMPEIASTAAHGLFEQALRELGEEKRVAVRAIQERFWESSERLLQTVDEMFLPGDVEQYRRLHRARREELAKILTPAEIDNLELKSSPLAVSLRNRLGTAFEPSEAELREIFQRQRDYEENYTVPGRVIQDTENKFAEEQSQAALAVDQSIQSLLGPERYAEYQRAQDYTFRSMADIAREANLPKEAAVRGYELIQAMRGQYGPFLNQLNNPASGITAEQRAQALLQFRQNYEEPLRQLFGDAGFRKLQPRLPGFPGQRRQLVAPGRAQPPP